MILVGAVFVSGPAELLAGMTPSALDVVFLDGRDFFVLHFGDHASY